MSQTLLEMVQDTLGEMISDEITSIEDSEEARTVARIYRRVYYDLAARMDFPEHEGIFNLTETTDNTKPVLMSRPDDVKNIEWVRYEKHTAVNQDLLYERVKFVGVKQFFDIMFNLVESDDNVETFTHTFGDSTFTFMYRTDKHPEIYTTLDDQTLVFDSVNTDVDTILTDTKTMCYGALMSTFTLSDSFVPDIEDQHMPLLVNEATKRAFDDLKDRIPDVINRTGRQLKITAQRTRPAVEYGHPDCSLPNYGRK